MLLLAATVLLQAASGAYGGESGGFPDEASHYVTGLMVHDYLVGATWTNPVRFAEMYYIHYPKVGIGHWPPVFYALQACWMIVCSPSRTSILGLMALLMALLAWTLYRVVAEESGKVAGVAMAMILIALPLAQFLTGMVMTEPLCALLCFRAALSYGRYIDGPRWNDATAFGIWASLAIMTRGTGLLLALVPPLSVLLSRRPGMLARLSFYWPALLVCLTCGPWYYLTFNMMRNGWQEHEPSLAYAIKAARFFLGSYPAVYGVTLILLAGIGLHSRVLRPFLRGGVDGRWAAIAALFVSVLVFHCVVPCSMDTRYLMESSAPLIALAGAGMARLADPIVGRRPRAIAVLSALTLVAFGWEMFTIPGRDFRGFRQVAEDLNALSGPRRSVTLVASDAVGEGAFISEMATIDERPGHVILRASKVLGTSDWLGTGYKPLRRTSREVMDYLMDVPVDFIVIDSWMSPSEGSRGPEGRLLGAIELDPGRWKFIGSYPLTRGVSARPGAIKVYRVLHGREGQARRISVDMRKMLGRAIEIGRPKPPD